MTVIGIMTPSPLEGEGWGEGFAPTTAEASKEHP
jgi:hypothetical protein